MKNKIKPQAAKPSPSPWELVDGSDGWTILDANNEVVGGNWDDKNTPALIARAVNAHAKLVKALGNMRAAVYRFEDDANVDAAKAETDMLFDELRAAGEEV